jgi:hypothetical protein
LSGADPDFGLDEGARKEQLWWWTYKPRQFGTLLPTQATRYLLEHQSVPTPPQPAGRRTLTGGKPHVPPSLAGSLTAVQRTACSPG